MLKNLSCAVATVRVFYSRLYYGMRFYLTILLLIYRDLLVFHSKLRHILLGHWLKVIKKTEIKGCGLSIGGHFWQLFKWDYYPNKVDLNPVLLLLNSPCLFYRILHFMPSFSEELFGSSDESKKSWLMKIDFWYSIVSLSVHICTERNSFLP